MIYQHTWKEGVAGLVLLVKEREGGGEGTTGREEGIGLKKYTFWQLKLPYPPDFLCWRVFTPERPSPPASDVQGPCKYTQNKPLQSTLTVKQNCLTRRLITHNRGVVWWFGRFFKTIFWNTPFKVCNPGTKKSVTSRTKGVFREFWVCLDNFKTEFYDTFVVVSSQGAAWCLIEFGIIMWLQNCWKGGFSEGVN